MIIFICDLILSLHISAKTIKEQLKISNGLKAKMPRNRKWTFD